MWRINERVNKKFQKRRVRPPSQTRLISRPDTVYIVDAKFTWTNAVSKWLNLVGREVFVAFTNAGWLIFSNFFCTEVKNWFYYIRFDAAQWVDFEYHLGFTLKSLGICKTNHSGIDTGFLGNPHRCLYSMIRYGAMANDKSNIEE